MPALSMLTLLGFIALCAAMVVATRLRNDTLLIAGLVVGVPLTAAVLITIGYVIGQSRTVHRWIGSLDPVRAHQHRRQDWRTTLTAGAIPRGQRAAEKSTPAPCDWVVRGQPRSPAPRCSAGYPER